MATVTFTPYRHQNAKVMRDVIDYCTQDKKVFDKESGCRLVSGVDCDGENAFAEFMTTKDCYKKANGIFFYHYTQSFSPDESITRMEAHEIALEFARQAWPGYEVLVSTHCDAHHPHSHFIVNSVSYVDGKKLRQPPDTLIKLRKLSDDICKEHELSVLTPYDGGGAKLSTREYRAAQKMQSWKFKLMSEINSAMKTSGSREAIEAALNSHGYTMIWTDERKYITFTCPGGKKFRDKTLHYDKYLKEVLSYEFEIRNKITEQCSAKQFARTARAVQRYSDDRRYSEEARRDSDPCDEAGGRISTDTGEQYTRSGRAGFRADNDSRYSEGASGSTYTGDDTGRGNSSCITRYDLPERQDRTSSDRHQEDLVSMPEREHRERHESYSTGGTESDGTVGRIHGHVSEVTDGIPVTGWEEERAEYLRRCQRSTTITGRLLRPDSSDKTMAADHSDHIVNSAADIAAAGIRALVQASDIIEDSSEDPEEKRRRIEAEQNLAAVGYALDAIAGLIEEGLDDDDEEENFDEQNYDEDDTGFVPVM